MVRHGEMDVSGSYLLKMAIVLVDLPITKMLMFQKIEVWLFSTGEM